MEGITPEEIAALKNGIFSSLHCALPGTVESFDPERGTAAVRPMAASLSLPLPLLYDVPVYLPEPREISPGAGCLLIFADRDIDAWLEGRDETGPASGRLHSLSDAFAFVGFHPLERRE